MISTIGDYVAEKTTGFGEWRDYLLGLSDGIPKTPEWQQAETGVPAKDAGASREFGEAVRHISPPAASAPASAARAARPTGAQWARCMVLMMAIAGMG